MNRQMELHGNLCLRLERLGDDVLSASTRQGAVQDPYHLSMPTNSHGATDFPCRGVSYIHLSACPLRLILAPKRTVFRVHGTIRVISRDGFFLGPGTAEKSLTLMSEEKKISIEAEAALERAIINK
jgi:hypothetical protein